MAVTDLCWVAASMGVNVDCGRRLCRKCQSVLDERIRKLREQGMRLKETRQTRGSAPNAPAQEVAAQPLLIVSVLAGFK
jgi:hypothetical protein